MMRRPGRPTRPVNNIQGEHHYLLLIIGSIDRWVAAARPLAAGNYTKENIPSTACVFYVVID